MSLHHDTIARELHAVCFSDDLIASPGRLSCPPLWRRHPDVVTRARELYRKPKASYRLGARFEALCAALIRAGGYYTIVACGFRATAAPDIPGEGDLLLRRRTDGVYLHVECTVKYYFADKGEGAFVHHWRGSLRRDRLDIKLAKLYQKQTRLLCLHNPRRGKTLRCFGMPKKTPVASAILYRGGFYPHLSDVCTAEKHIPAVFRLPHALKGAYVRAGEIDIVAAYYREGEYCVFPVNRYAMLAPHCADCIRGSMPMKDALTMAKEKTTACHAPIALALTRRSGGIAYEKKRLYILPDLIPNQAD